jgi:ABC-type nitrate/sulfonate/bicarbonate transport system permease component
MHTVSLHNSRKQHILKSRRLSALIALFWFALALIIILLFTQFSGLDLAQLWLGFLVSLARVSTAYVIAISIAIALSLLITAEQTVENIFLPLFDVLQSFPSFALFPVLVTLLPNANEVIIVFVLVLSMVWEMLFTIVGGIKNQRADLEEAATIFGAKGFDRLIHFTLPSLLPSIITGSIIGWGEAWEFIIGAELLVSVHFGIGHYLGTVGNAGQNTLLGLGIFVLMLLLFIVNKLVWLPLLRKATAYETES